jgi:hypothetical protein
LAVSRHRGHTDDLTWVDRERDVAQMQTAGRVRYFGVLDLKCGRQSLVPILAAPGRGWLVRGFG